ncbi:MAG TPA: DUF2793 domain-containing protein [Nitrosopumilaceae archaeon]|jgi:hypothetical protein|nr:DUF2793 domain-containing protein [Nitrosopumilaceae archaeon]
MAVNQLSLNQLIQYFAQLAAKDDRINTFGYGPIYDVTNGPYFNIANENANSFNIDTKVRPTYPMLWVEPSNSKLRRDSIVISHKLHFLDLVEKDGSNRIDIMSDTLRSAQEVKAFIFKDFFYDIFPTDESTLTPIWETYDDSLGGYVLDLDLQVDWLADVCSIPGLYPSGNTFIGGPGYFNVSTTGYLPLTGGQLSGNLSGTNAFFNTISGVSISATTFYSGSTDLSLLLGQILQAGETFVQPGLNTYTGGTNFRPTINVSALTISSLIVTGATILQTVSATAFSGGSFFSGGTDLGSLFLSSGATFPQTHVQPGTNISTGGTSLNPVVNVVSNPVFTSISAVTISGSSIFSGSTDLSSLFLSSGATFPQTHVQNGLNTYTGGTSLNPSVNVSAATLSSLTVSGLTTLGIVAVTTISGTTFYSGSTDVSLLFPSLQSVSLINSQLTTKANLSGATFTGNINTPSLSATTLSGGTIYSGSTDVSLLFATPQNISLINSQLATKANLSGATFTGTINTPVLSATTLSGGTILSGSTNLYSIFSQLGNSVQSIGQGSNISTGGTATNPIINVVGSPQFNNLGFSGTATGNILTAQTISATTSVVSTAFNYANNPVAGYVLTTDINGNATWQIPPTAGVQAFFFYGNESPSDIGGYDNMKSLASVGSAQTITNAGVTNNQTLASWATVSGGTNLTFLPAGVITVYISATQSSGTKTTFVYAEIFKRSSGGSETLLATTANSIPLVSVSAAFVLQAAITGQTTLLTSDRIVTKVLAGVSGGGSAPTVVLTVEDSTAGRTELPATVVDSTLFVPYTGATGNVNLATRSMSASSVILSTGFQLIPSGQTGYILTSDSLGNGFWEPGASVPSGAELPPVISVLNTPPSANTVGDTYLIGTGGTAAWSASSNDESVYVSGTTWTFTAPVKNNTVFVTNTLTTLLWNGTAWVAFNGVAILQNGNTLGSTMNIGTNDNNKINFKISGNTKWTITTGGTLTNGTQSVTSFGTNISGNTLISVLTATTLNNLSLPFFASTNNIVFASATNTWAGSTNFQYDGTKVLNKVNNGYFQQGAQNRNSSSTSLSLSNTTNVNYLEFWTNGGLFYMGPAGTNGANNTFAIVSNNTTNGNSIMVDNISGGVTIGAGTTQGRLVVGGGVAATTWGVAGILANFAAATFTDNIVSSGQTISKVTNVSFGAPAFASASISTVFTDGYTVYVGGSPTNGANVTITRPWAFASVGGNNQFVGKTYFGASGVKPQVSVQITGGTFTDNFTATTSVNLTPTGSALLIATGSTNAVAGVGTLVSGTATISTTSLTNSSLVFVTDTSTSLTNVGSLTVPTNSITGGTGFKVVSTNVLDTSTFNWFFIN